jgi:hypothetical protein
MRAKGQGLIDLRRWGAEPSTPREVAPERFAAALREICGWMPPARPHRYAKWVLAYARRFRVDPFLLGGLIFRQSICLPRHESDYGVGLTAIDERMHAPFIRRRRYHFHVFEGGAWVERKLAMDRFLFIRANLRRAEPSIYFAAAILSVFTQQCRQIDGAFGSVPHRHPVSHVIWGDRVRDAGSEDRVLRARRRLLQYYEGAPPAVRGAFSGMPLASPLDGPPLKVSSVMGEERADGARRHLGIDLQSAWGEPVRAVADGVVSKAGVDRPGGEAQNLSPEEARAVRRRTMGPGGLFVMVRHKGGLLSAYMHLSSYTVQAGDRVTARQLIGRVGRTGMKEGSAHLHFELRHRGVHVDPVPHLAAYLLLPNETFRGRRLAWEQERLRKRRRRLRRRAIPSRPRSSAGN